MAWNLTVGDLYPPLPGVLTDTNGPVSLASGVASGVQLMLKSAGGTISGSATILQAAFTATTVQNSATLSAVSSFTNIWGPGVNVFELGSTIFGPGVPAPVLSGGVWTLPTVLSYNSGSQTITMSQPATAAGTAVNLIANIGTVQYSWTTPDTASGHEGDYKGGWQVTWTTGSKPQFFPTNPSDQIEVILNALP